MAGMEIHDWRNTVVVVAEKGKPASLKILNVQNLLGQERTKSRVVPPAAGVTGDLKKVPTRTGPCCAPSACHPC